MLVPESRTSARPVALQPSHCWFSTACTAPAQLRSGGTQCSLFVHCRPVCTTEIGRLALKYKDLASKVGLPALLNQSLLPSDAWCHPDPSCPTLPDSQPAHLHQPKGPYPLPRIACRGSDRLATFVHCRA